MHDAYEFSLKAGLDIMQLQTIHLLPLCPDPDTGSLLRIPELKEHFN